LLCAVLMYQTSRLPWSSAQEHVHWALGHLGITPTTRIRLDTSHAQERAMPTQQPTEESPDTVPLLRVLTALRQGDWRTSV